MLKNYGSNYLLTNIINNQLIVLTPITNSKGYYEDKREEDGIDPNRDFPYYKDDFNTTDKCMRSITGRTVNEIFRENIITLSITFHGGMEAFPLGNLIHMEIKEHKKMGLESPDYYALKGSVMQLSLFTIYLNIGSEMVYYSTSDDKEKIAPYKFGDMTSVVII